MDAIKQLAQRYTKHSIRIPREDRKEGNTAKFERGNRLF